VRRVLVPVFAGFLTSCGPHISPAQLSLYSAESSVRSEIFQDQSPRWPAWRPAYELAALEGTNATPDLAEGVFTFGPAANGEEEILVTGERTERTPAGMGKIPLAFMPTSYFKGASPYDDLNNTLNGPRGECFIFQALNYRSTVFQLYPATTPKSKGTLFYHTSIMLLSSAEAGVVKRFRKRGWNVVVALPSDSLYRSRLPVYLSQKEDPEAAARYLAEDMDRHFHEQGQALKLARAYLKKTRPGWLGLRQILMGTSGGSFSLPAVALKNPKVWDKIIFISPGANLMKTYEKGAANIFPSTLAFVDTIRGQFSPEDLRIPSREEYRRMYLRAAELTRLQPSSLAPLLRHEKVLFLNGSKDAILPKEEIENAYLALGRPERWTYPLGHHLIALNLLTQTGRLEKWILQD